MTEEQIGIIILINPKHSEALDDGEKLIIFFIWTNGKWMTVHGRMTLYWKMDDCALNG